MVISERAIGSGIDEAAVFALAQRVRGEVVTPGHEAYERTRQLWNAAFDRFPAVIVRAEGTADVAEAVRFANEHGLEIAVRSGGHSLAGLSMLDGAVVVDMSGDHGVEIDVQQRLAWVSPGLTSEELAAQTLPHGLVLTTGDAPTVGVGGLTLGGGIGWMVRKHGLTIDHLVAAEIVTADGRVTIASAEQHPDLFWALRGGGGNFGIVTRFQFRLDPTGLILGGLVALPMTAEAVRGYVELATAAPDELSTQLIVSGLPPAPFVPEHLVGTPAAIVALCWAGDIEEGRKVVAPFSQLAGGALIELVEPMPYSVLFDFLREPTQPGMFGSARSAFVSRMDDDLIDVMVSECPPPMSIVQLRVLGGAMARVPGDATAFAHRDKEFMFSFLGHAMTPDLGAVAHEWVERLWAQAGGRADGVYVNFLGSNDAPERIHEAYPGTTYDRLVEVKRKYDPENRFHGNQNIRVD
jgi:FAD/FMN-containing dehydrogenase